MTVFICTVGISIAEKIYERKHPLIVELENAPVSETNNRKAEMLREVLKARVKGCTSYLEQRDLCAELSALYAYADDRDTGELNPEIDRVELLHSDNMLGLVCAEMLKLALEHFHRQDGKFQVNLHCIEHLDIQQIKDKAVKPQDGLAKFAAVLVGLLRQYKNEPEVVLNATGGYKALMPYTTLAGTLFDREVVYVFEESDALVRLPHLATNLDLAALEKIKPLLLKLYQREKITQLPQAADDWKTLFQKNKSDFFQLTPIGWLIAGRYLV